jgi:hypothetical protein
MAIDDPEYTARIGEWTQMRDTYKGERAVKSKRLEYLPATEAWCRTAWGRRTRRAGKTTRRTSCAPTSTTCVRDAVKAMVGIMHMKPASSSCPSGSKR